MPKGPGSSFYQGVNGPDFGGKLARYILITAVTNHGGSCYGLGEVKFNGTIATTSSVGDELSNIDIIATPNPFSVQTTIHLNGLTNGNLTLEVFDLMGRKMKTFIHNVKNEKDEMPLYADDLSSGFYLLKLTQKEDVKTIKLEIIK